MWRTNRGDMSGGKDNINWELPGGILKIMPALRKGDIAGKQSACAIIWASLVPDGLTSRYMPYVLKLGVCHLQPQNFWFTFWIRQSLPSLPVKSDPSDIQAYISCLFCLLLTFISVPQSWGQETTHHRTHQKCEFFWGRIWDMMEMSSPQTKLAAWPPYSSQTTHLRRKSANFFCDGWHSKYSHFVGCMAYVIIKQHHCFSVKAAMAKSKRMAVLVQVFLLKPAMT